MTWYFVTLYHSSFIFNSLFIIFSVLMDILTGASSCLLGFFWEVINYANAPMPISHIQAHTKVLLACWTCSLWSCFAEMINPTYRTRTLPILNMFFYFYFLFIYSTLPFSLTVCFSKNRLSSAMNPVYSPVQPGTPYGNPKNMAFPGTIPHYRWEKSISFIFPVKNLQMIGDNFLRMKSSIREGVFW